jgi:16S rRNA (cytosine1402-N4)-methyltransferase
MSDESSQPPAHKRRVRYKGTHPKTFKDKYKESSDPAVIEKIISKGGTPAGTHRPIMVTEILEALNPQPGQIFVDCTLGYGGHASEILKRLQDPEGKRHGRLIAFDRDPIESEKTETRIRALGFAPESFTIIHDNFSEIEPRLKALGLLGQVDGVLADLGLSSMQIDNPSRGFTFKHEGPLDLRMNPLKGQPASELLKRLSPDELQALLEENSDEPRAKWCAKAILDQQKKKPIETTTEFANAIKAWIKTLSPKTREQEGDTPIRRAMQALRIEVNQEFTSLDRLLEALPRALNKHGRVAILSFHSGEDRRVKKSFQSFAREGIYQSVSPEATRPTMDEQRSNTRSKSAKLRLAKR